MRAALGEIGFADALLVREEDGQIQIIDGHLRAGIALDQEVPVLVLDVTAEEADKLLATFDPITGLAEADVSALRELADSIDFDSKGLRAMVDEMLASAGGTVEIEQDEVPAVPGEATTQPGDLYVLGEHRVLCGDATKAEDVDRVMDGEQAATVTDPPYGVGYEYESWDDSDSVVNDALFHHINKTVGPLIYFCGSVNLLREMNRGRCKVLIWHKPWSMTHSGIGNGRHHWEPIIVRNLTKGAYLASDVLVQSTDRIPGLRDAHSCPKPVGLLAALIEALVPDGVVYDPFLGSGTTIIAAEQLGRKCYGIEIEPRYVDVIVERWENLTGQRAERIEAEAVAT